MCRFRIFPKRKGGGGVKTLLDNFKCLNFKTDWISRETLSSRSMHVFHIINACKRTQNTHVQTAWLTPHPPKTKNNKIIWCVLTIFISIGDIIHEKILKSGLKICVTLSNLFINNIFFLRYKTKWYHLNMVNTISNWNRISWT